MQRHSPDSPPSKYLATDYAIIHGGSWKSPLGALASPRDQDTVQVDPSNSVLQAATPCESLDDSLEP